MRRRKSNPTLSIRGDLDGVVRHFEFESVTEEPGGKVRALRPDGRWETFSRSRIAAIDGQKPKRGGTPATQFSRTIPMPESVDRGRNLVAFYQACSTNRSLRVAVERARAIHAADGRAVITELGHVLDVAVLDELDRHGHEVVRPASDFVGGVVWDARARRKVKRDLFKALAAWGVFDETWVSRGERIGGFSRYPMGDAFMAYHEEFADVVGRVYRAAGGLAFKTVFSPVWDWYGMDNAAVHNAFVKGQMFGHWWYDRTGSIVDITFPKSQ